MKVYRICLRDDLQRGCMHNPDPYDYAQRIGVHHGAGNHPDPFSTAERCTHLSSGFRYRGCCEYRLYFFGCASKAQLKRCFPSFAGRKAWHQVGYALHVFEVDPKHVWVGNHQVAFQLAEATLVEVIDLLNFR